MKQKTGKFYLALVIFSLVGQVAWVMENMYFNVFIYKMFNASADAISAMVAASAIAATVTTLLVGAFSDKIGKRKLFICGGYMLWGVSILSFALIRMDVINVLFPAAASAASVGVSLVIVMDCVMTFFGSTANDAAFNAWVTDNTRAAFRGKVEGVLAVLPLIAMLIVAGGFGILVELVGYQTLFLGLGIVVSLCGILGIVCIRDSDTLVKNGGWKDIFYGFLPRVIRENPALYLALLIMGVYGVACQIFMPYLIIYMKTYLGFSVLEYSVVFGVAIVLGALFNVWFGGVSDRMNKAKLLYVAAAIFALGLFGMYVARPESHIATLVLFGVAGFVMITGYILISALCGALVRDHTPVRDAGKLQGVRMVFGVLLPMLIGPMIGNAINQRAALPLPDMESADIMTTQYIPAPEIFFMGAIVSLLLFALIPLLVRMQKKSQQRGIKNATENQV